ncbi:MAG TPA: amidohydrolase family protein [Thermoanaerobaculia bacterium]|nr:amidohydrolase family protein [Thermoanaerobaculia bacterium]
MNRAVTPGRRILRGLILLIALVALPAMAVSQEQALVLAGARIYTGPEAAPIFDGVIVVQGGKVVAVGPRDAVKPPDGARTLDCTGLVITAGFQNSHVHFTEEKWADAEHQASPKLTSQLQEMLARYGFTTVVDTGSSLENTTALRRRIESGDVAGPRILTAGSPLYPPNGIPYYLKDTLPAEILKLLPQPSTPQQAEDVVRKDIGGGADITKLFTGSWIAHGKVMPMPDDLASAAAAEAHRQGKLVFTHPSNVAGLEVALRTHVDVLAHAIEDTRGFTPEHLQRMKQQNMALIPTLKLFAKDRYLFEILDEVRDYERSGGQILFGTDVGYLTDYDPTAEYLLLESAGLGWREILSALTTNPAARFGEASRRGRIAPGMDADLVVLATDPVADLRAFTNVRYTLRGGKVIYSAPPRAP